MDIAFINSGYLEWVMGQGWFCDLTVNRELLDAIQAELDIRDKSDGHFMEDKVRV